MPAIRIVEAGSIPWMKFRGDEPVERLEEDDPQHNGAVRNTHPGGDTELSLKEVRIAPDTDVVPHAHRSDEIVYVLDGELHLGPRVLKPGSSVLIPGMTLYGFRSGPQGLCFLNFRPRLDRSHLTKQELVAERRPS